MASEEGMVVFRRGEDNENDIWDDSALIQAYDNAVSIVKADLAKKNGDINEMDLEKTVSSKKHKRRRKHKAKKDKNHQHQRHSLFRWNVGDYCRGVYTEDGQVYEATIKSIDQEKQSCVLKYVGYGNEEEQLLNDLLPSALYSNNRSRQNTQSQSEADTMDCLSPGINSARATPQQRVPQSQPLFQMPPTVPPFPVGLPPFPAMPPSFPPMNGLSMLWPGCGISNSPRLPTVPSPPPFDEELVESDNEALCSMLMAWYMSGYHSGYYQGLKAGKKASRTNTGATQTADTTPVKIEQSDVADG